MEKYLSDEAFYCKVTINSIEYFLSREAEELVL